MSPVRCCLASGLAPEKLGVDEASTEADVARYRAGVVRHGSAGRRRLRPKTFGWTAPLAAAALLLPLVVIAGENGATAAVPDVVASSQTACPDVLILGARGSGEAPQGVEPADYNGPDRGLGSTLTSFTGPLEAQLAGQGLVVRTEGVVYDAVPVLVGTVLESAVTLPVHIATIASSARGGAAEIRRRIQVLRSTDCGLRTKVVLAGYSQGGWAVRRAYFLLEPDERAAVSSIVLFGDPLYRSNEPGILYWKVPRSPSIVGVARAMDGKKLPGGGRLRIDPNLEGNLPGEIARSYCLPRDIVCRFKPQNVGNDAHSRYPNEATSVAANWVASKLAATASEFPRLATAQPVAAAADGRVNVALASDRGLAPFAWSFDGSGAISARGVTLAADGQLSGLLTSACPAAGCTQDIVVTAADGRTARVTLTVTGGPPATPPWTRVVVGPDATATSAAVPPDEPFPCPTTPYAVEPGTRAVVQGVATTFLEDQAKEIRSYLLVLETFAVDAPLPDEVLANPIYQMGVSFAVDTDGNGTVELVEVISILRQFAEDLLSDASVTATVDQLTKAAGMIPAGVDPATFIGHYDPMVPPAPQLLPTCVAAQPTAGSRLWHYGLYRDLGWFVDLPGGPAGSRFVRLEGLPSLADSVAVPVVEAAVPTWVVMRPTDTRWNSPLYLLTVDSPPVDTCPGLSDSSLYNAIMQRVQAEGLEYVFQGVRTAWKRNLLINIALAAVNTPKECWTVQASLTPITAPGGRHVTASDYSFTVTPDGRHLAVTEVRSLTNAYGDAYQVQVVERFELAGTTAVSERQVMLGGPPTHGYFATVGVSLSPDGRYLSTCNAGFSPSTYDAVTDTMTYPQNVPWRTPFPVCRILSTSNGGLVTFIGSSPDPQVQDYVLWTYQDPE